MLLQTICNAMAQLLMHRHAISTDYGQMNTLNLSKNFEVKLKRDEVI
jgi:hypothetical protein